MHAKLIFFCLCLFISTSISSVIALQGPAGEVIRRPPPPVNETAAARAQQAARLRKKAAIADQFELALKNANAAASKYWNNYSSNQGLSQAGFYEAEAAYKRAAQLQPNDWRSFAGLGSLYTPYHMAEAALANKRASDLRPNDLQLINSLAYSYLNQGKYSEAISPLERSLKLDPSKKNERAYDDLASAYDHVGLYDKAIVTLKRRLALLPDKDVYRDSVHRDMAEVYTHARRFSEALEEYKQAKGASDEFIRRVRELLAALPDSDIGKRAEAHYMIGHAYERRDQFSEAIVEYKEAIRLKRDNADYYLSLGDTYDKAKRYPEAIEVFDQARQLNPKTARADIGIGNAYGETGDFEKAAQAFARARQLEPNNFSAVGQLGVVYYLLKKYEMSLEPLQQALRLKPEEGEDLLGWKVEGLHYYLGMSQLMLGHKSEAMQQYEELKKLKSGAADKLLSEINKH